MPESAPRNELELIDLRKWRRIFGPEQLVQIHESSLDQPDGAVRDREWLATEANLAALADRRPLSKGATAQVPLCRGVSATGMERPRKRYRGRNRGPRFTSAPILARHITRRRPPARFAPAPSR
jgi:hypothetical protein